MISFALLDIWSISGQMKSFDRAFEIHDFHDFTSRTFLEIDSVFRLKSSDVSLKFD